MTDKKTSRTNILKKHLNVVVVFSIVVGLLGATLVYSQVKKNGMPDANCLSGAATTFAPPSLTSLSSEASIIVLADASEISQDNYVFRVRENIKGETLRVNDTFRVCTEMSVAKNNSSNSVIFFLEGYDKSQDMWVPVQFEAGIVPKMNGKYKLPSEHKSLSLDEIRKIIKAQN